MNRFGKYKSFQCKNTFIKFYVESLNIEEGHWQGSFHPRKWRQEIFENQNIDKW